MQLGEGVSQLQQEEQEGQPMPCLASGGKLCLASSIHPARKSNFYQCIS